MREKQILPVAVIGLTAMLVAVVALWTLDRVEGAGTAAVSGSGPVDVIEWKLVTTWPKGLPGLGAAPENFARRVNEASGGRLRIKVFGAGEIVPAFEVFDAVSRGVAEAGHGASYYWKGKIPGFSVLHGGAVRHDGAGGERLAPLWWRPRAVARALRTLWRGPVCGGQHRRSNGGLVQYSAE